MKKTLKLLFFIALLNIVLSLSHDNVKAQTSEKGQITGIILDITNNMPVEGASIKLMKETTIIKGTETGTDGKFTLNDIDYGKYTLQIFMTGYKSSTTQEILIDGKNNNTELASLKISPENYTTEEIKVEAEKSAIEFSADKKVFDVEKALNTQGGNAIDVIRKLPSVSVDAEGNISMRGSQNVKILINGKSSGLDGQNRTTILEQIPANQISNIEIISNPGAKYDAEGTSGIINVILKKNEGLGYNGNLTLNAGTRDKYYGTFGLNMRKNNLNIYGNYNYRISRFLNEGSNDRTNYILNTSLLQNNSGTWKNNSHFGKGGIDYEFGDKNSLSISGNYFSWDNKGDGNSDYISFDNSGSVISRYLSNTSSRGNGNGFNTELNYSKKYKTPNRELTGDFYFSRNNFNMGGLITQYWLIPYTANPELLNQFSGNRVDEFSGQFDYVHPLSETFKVESGIKGLYRRNSRDFLLENFDYTSNQFLVDASQSNNFEYKEQIYSAYGTFSGKYKDFGFKLGFRTEGTLTKGELITTSTIFDREYFDIFPSASISQKLGATEELQLTFSRRINRPQLWALNPFRISWDPSNKFSGNPELKPEYIDSYELSFMKFFASTSITPSLFFRNTHDKIDRTRILLDSNTALVTFNNFANSKSYGAELILNTTLFKIWNINGSASYFRTEVDAGNIQQGLTNSAFTWSGRLTSNLSLPEIANFQVVYYYSGKTVVAQGELAPFTSFDFTVSRDFFVKRLNVALRFADIFNTMKFNVNVNDPAYRELFFRKNDSRNVFLTLTYKFGTQEKKQEKRKPKDNGNNESNPQNGFGF